jgi:hypothetical protein
LYVNILTEIGELQVLQGLMVCRIQPFPKIEPKCFASFFTGIHTITAIGALGIAHEI